MKKYIVCKLKEIATSNKIFVKKRYQICWKIY